MVATPDGNPDLTVNLEIERSCGGELSAGVLVTCEPNLGPLEPR